MDTIFAVSSGQPPAAIAVVRISGPEAVATARAVCGVLPAPRQAALRAVRDPVTGDLLDRALILWFAGPATATGEDLVEIHLHGGRAIVAAVLRALGSQPGLRAADPGEFTRRALAAGRIDLAEAEGLGDLLMAETEAQRRRALAAAEGLVSRAVAGWSGRLLALSAQAEALLDFSDEDDVAQQDGEQGLAAAIASLASDMERTLAVPTVERLRDGIRVTLAGPPNSGKSTLLNAMADREAAIVSPIAGTTRDRIEIPVIRGGVAYVLTDTAGLVDHSDDPVEAIGVDRARTSIETADIVLWLGDGPPPDRANVLALYPRADIRPVAEDRARLPISAATGLGMDALWARLQVMARSVLPPEDQLAVNQRQRALLADAAAELHDAISVQDLLIVAEHLRRARGALDRITGTTHVEEMLDALFGKFCIGK